MHLSDTLCFYSTNQCSLLNVNPSCVFPSLFVVFDIINRGSSGRAGFTGMWRNLRVYQITCTAWPWCPWPSLTLQSTRTGASTSHLPASTSLFSHSYEHFFCAYNNFVMCRCIKLALVHDMAECIVGDITPADNISKAEKHRREEGSPLPLPTDAVTWSCFNCFLSFFFRKQWDTSQVFYLKNSNRSFMRCGRCLAFLLFVDPER